MIHLHLTRLAGSTPKHPRTRFQPRSESLEQRSLLSTVPVAPHQQNVQVVENIFQHILHHDPAPKTLAILANQLDRHARSPVGEALQLLASREYQHTHPNPASFVQGLYHDVLGTNDPQAEAFWTTQLQTHRIRPARLATTFLKSSDSFPTQQPPSSIGGGSPLSAVTSITVNPPSVTSISGNQAQASLVYNQGNLRPQTITITVSAAGSYILNQTNSWGAINNTGSTWRSYNLTIMTSQSSARPTFSNASDLSNQLPTVTRTTNPTSTIVTFSGGRGVPTGPSPSFMPQTVFTTSGAGSIVIVEQPSLR